MEICRQISLIFNENPNEYAEMTFKNALLSLLEKYPEKKWVPKEINKTLLERGFQTKSEDFGNIVRAMLKKFRDDEIVEAEKIKVGKMEMWQYSHKKQETDIVKRLKRRSLEFKE